MEIKKLTGIFLFLTIFFSCGFGKGKISVEIGFPEKTLVYPQLSVTAQMTGGESSEYSNQDGKELLISAVEAGQYTLVIRLKDGKTVVWEKQISCVVDGAITTKIRYTITEEDFTDFALYPPQIIATELGENRYKIEIISVNYKGDICYTMVNPAEDPTASSSRYEAPFEIDYTTEEGKVITARVFYKDFNPSEAAVLHLTKVETPVLNDTTVHRLSDRLTFSVTSSDNEASYYYTLDGTVPTAVSTQTNGIIEMSQPGTITVKGFKETYLMSDSVSLPVERLPLPVFGEITENADALSYSLSIDYGENAELMFLTRDKTAVTADNCPMDTAVSLTGSTVYAINDLLPEETLKTRSGAVNFFPSEEAVLESQSAEKPLILDARAETRSWAESFFVKFSTPETGATLRYTFDATVPGSSSSSTGSGEPVEVPAGTTEIQVRSYVAGKYPSTPVTQAVDTASDPVSVSLGYWNEIVIEDASTLKESEKDTRELFYRKSGDSSWILYETGSYLEADQETEAEVIGGAEFHFPSATVSRQFDLLQAPVPADTRAADAGYLDVLTVDLTSGSADSTRQYYTTRNGEDPTPANSQKESDASAVTVERSQTLKAVVSQPDKITSQPVTISGTPLSQPKTEIDDAGNVTVSPADSDASVSGIIFFYKISDESAFTSASPGTLYSANAAPKLDAGQTLYVVAAAPMRNPSDVATLSLEQTDPPQIIDTRSADGSFYRSLRLAVEGEGSLFYQLGAAESDVDDPVQSYTDPVTPAASEAWMGAAAKAADKMKSETVRRQLYSFTAAPAVSLNHNAPDLFNILTISLTETAIASPSLYYIWDGSDFETGNSVREYSAPVSIPNEMLELLPAGTSEVTVKSIAGAEYAYPSSQTETVLTRSAQPVIADARAAGKYYKPLEVSSTEDVYVSTDNQTWKLLSGGTAQAVEASVTAVFMKAESGKVTSPTVTVLGAALDRPEVTVAADGQVTVASGSGENSGDLFYYVINNGASVDFGTEASVQEYQDSSRPVLQEGETIHVTACKELRNPSEAVSAARNDSEPPAAPTVSDSRSLSGTQPGGYFDPRTAGSITLNVSQADNVSVFYTVNGGSPQPVSGSSVTASRPSSGSDTYVFYADNGSKRSDSVTVEVKVLSPPVFNYSLTALTASLESSDGADILYELQTDKTDVTAASPVYSGFANLAELPGKTVTAVAVKEFCFSSSQMEQSIPSTVVPPVTQTPDPPTVTDSRTASGSNYFNPRSNGSITLTVTPADSSHRVFYRKGNSGSETEITGNELQVDRSGADTYYFYSKSADGSQVSSEVPVTVSVLQKPVITNNNGTAALSSPDGADILYTAADSGYEAVTENSSKYSSSTNLIGKYVSAVAVKEFCFSSDETQEQVPAATAEPVQISFQDASGKTMVNGTYREQQTVTITATPAGAAISYSIGDQTYANSYTGPVTVSENTDLYVKAVNGAETATAVLKIRLKCPNPSPQLTVSADQPDKYELTFTDIDTSLFTIKVADNVNDNTGTDYSAPMLLKPNESVIIFATRTGWESSDKILISVPEILKKKGLAD